MMFRARKVLEVTNTWPGRVLIERQEGQHMCVFADPVEGQLATDVRVYFCDPHKPWQRGSNETATRLLRQYFSKGVDGSNASQVELDAVARTLNERPGKTPSYETPAERCRPRVPSIG